MAFNAILTVEDKTFRILSFNYFAERHHDLFGRPTSQLFGFKIELLLEHSPDCVLLHDWAYKNHDVKSGKITFMRRDNEQKQTEIRFSEGYIVSINTNFANTGESPMTEMIKICARNFEYESQGKITQYDLGWSD